MELKDVFLAPIYLTVIYCIAFLVKHRYVKDHKIKKYFIPALTFKIIGGILLGLIYQFYYRGGDTIGYFTLGSNYVWDALINEPLKGFQLLLDSGGEYKMETIEYASKIPCYPSPQAFLIVKLSAFLGLFSFHTYVVNSIFFSLISFVGVWAMFITFYRLYPALHKQFAIICFFIPSLFFWGSGILKDSITFGFLGLAFYALHNVFHRKEKITKNLILLFFSIYILQAVKIYILMCFIPAFSIWIFMDYTRRLKSQSLKAMIRPILFVFSIIVGLVSTYFISEDDQSYNFSNIVETSYITGTYLTYSSKESSRYDLGEMDNSLEGMLLNLPEATWVSLFRPYIWEAHNPIMLLSAFESLCFLIFFIITLLKVGPIKCISIVKSDPFILSLLLFSLAFAFAIGISTYNFGTLVRYRIPLIPFFLSAIAIIKYQYEHAKKLKRLKVEYKSDSSFQAI